MYTYANFKLAFSHLRFLYVTITFNDYGTALPARKTIMKQFIEAGLPEPLFHRLQEMAFTTPTPIQAESIPHALAGRDILGSAQTGTGKTGAFGIPLVARLLNNPRGDALVLLPTRELAMQVMTELKKFIGSSKIKHALLIGGEPMPKQISQLRARPRLIIGTPGRINDHLERGTLMLHQTQFLVLDEADRMLDMGFGKQLDVIAKYLTASRQTLLFSATMPKNINALSAKYLTDPVRVSVAETHKPNANVSEERIMLDADDKYDYLLGELGQREGSIIIFMKQKHAADRMAVRLRKAGHQAEAIHGDLRQNIRTKVIKDFRASSFRILVATDVAARGLDVPHVEHVINYDIPMNPEDYIHRIGRTGRAGASGAAISFLSPNDGAKWNAIQKLVNPKAKPEMAEIDDTPQRKAKHKPKPWKGRKASQRRSGGGKPQRNAKPHGRRNGTTG